MFTCVVVYLHVLYCVVFTCIVLCLLVLCCAYICVVLCLQVCVVFTCVVLCLQVGMSSVAANYGATTALADLEGITDEERLRTMVRKGHLTVCV